MAKTRIAPVQYAEEFFALAVERERIRRLRETGAEPPWSDDPIFNEWRFTNVHRENDKTTIWFRENVRRHVEGLLAVEACLIFRWFNRISTGERIRDLLVLGWDSDIALHLLDGVKPLVTGAYMVHSPYGMNKLDGLLHCIDEARLVLPGIYQVWTYADRKRPLTMREAWRDVCRLPNMGEFSAGEVVCDLRWTPVLSSAPDINTWCAIGPGCARGLGYAVDGNPARYRYGSEADTVEMLAVMAYLLTLSREEDYWPQGWQPWELHEVEMWSCEYAKYKNAQAGQRLKRRYVYVGTGSAERASSPAESPLVAEDAGRPAR